MFQTVPWIPHELSPHFVPGHISRAEGQWLRALARGKLVLEVGAFRGRSTVYLGSSARRLITCDHFRGQKRLQPGQQPIDMRAVELDWHDNLQAFGLRSKVRLLRMDSKDCYDLLRSNRVHDFGLVFVDGGHDDESVRADMRFTELLSPGGVIAFHDYCSAKFPGIKRVVDERAANLMVQLVCVPATGSIGAFRRTAALGSVIDDS